MAAPAIPPPETTWQIIRDWMTAVGTIGAAAAAVYFGGIRDRWRRPKLDLTFDPDPGAQDLVVVEVAPQYGREYAAYYRLRVVEKKNRAAAEDVEVTVVRARVVDPAGPVLEVGTSIRIEG
ncbi:MAG TPA: hypothetical protein VFH80_16140, partial [Solirubrobacteraceae bacterium]|nr:hypothetical protein [Solirubrobacteraceae bacterium]